MPAGGALRALTKDHLRAFDAVPHQLAARHLGAETIGSARRKAPVDEVVLRVIRMQDHVHQPALAVRRDLRQACDRLRVQLAVPGDAQAAFAFGHQHAAVRQECERPGMAEAGEDPGNGEAVLIGAVGLGAGGRTSERQYQGR